MTTEKSKQGKKNRRKGATFERKVRADLESKGWIVDKWTNNVEFHNQGGVGSNPAQKGTDVHILTGDSKWSLRPAKSNRFNMRTCGFPDFIAFRFFKMNKIYKNPIRAGGNCPTGREKILEIPVYEVIAVECKTNGRLDKVEKEKCQWLLSNNIFSKILVASVSKEKRGEIVYKEVENK